MATIYLFLWEDVDMAFDALLTHVCPAVAGHPLSFTFRAHILSKTPLFALIWS